LILLEEEFYSYILKGELVKIPKHLEEALTLMIGNDKHSYSIENLFGKENKLKKRNREAIRDRIYNFRNEKYIHRDDSEAMRRLRLAKDLYELSLELQKNKISRTDSSRAIHFPDFP
jgi:hypothetical protein